MSSDEPMSAPLGRPENSPSERVPGLPVAMFRYFVAIGILGPAVSAALLVAGFGAIGRGDILPSVLLTVLTAAGVRYPLQLRHRTLVVMRIVGCLAMILSLPVALPGILTIVATVVGRAGRRRDRAEAAFDIGQVSLFVSMCAVFFWGAKDLTWLGPEVAGLGRAGAVVLTPVLAYLLNTSFVSIAAALHARRNPVRVWIHNLRDDYVTEGTLAGTGVVGGVLAAHYPVTLPLLAFPFVLLHQALEHATRLRSDTFAALVKLNEVVEISDPYTAGHSVRVGEMSRVIALRMNLTVEEVDDVGSAGEVHDVGKIGIDPEILKKSDLLEPWEMDQMKLHPSLGADIVARFTTSGPIAAYVRHHHEWLNGSGYPDGLAGEAIPLGARIIAVADTFDALTSKRPYRDPLSPTDALLVLRDGAGKQWDATVVAAVFAHARSLGIPLPTASTPEPVRLTDLSPV